MCGGTTGASPVKVTGTRLFARKVSIPRKYGLRGHIECHFSLFEILFEPVFFRFSREFNMLHHLYRADHRRPHTTALRAGWEGRLRLPCTRPVVATQRLLFFFSVMFRLIRSYPQFMRPSEDSVWVRRLLHDLRLRIVAILDHGQIPSQLFE